MQLTEIRTLTARLQLLSGLHIGAGDSEMHIGGVDKQVVRHPISKQPYIPGSSLKGKMRSLLEWKSGAVEQKALGWDSYTEARPEHQGPVLAILKLFGVSGDAKLDAEKASVLGPSRLAFWDAEFHPEWVRRADAMNTGYVEVKAENSINRITGVAVAPRFFERIPAGAEFDFRLTLKVLNGETDLLPTVLAGLHLIELDSLGGSGSRGYGKVKFDGLKLDGEPVELPGDPFTAA